MAAGEMMADVDQARPEPLNAQSTSLTPWLIASAVILCLCLLRNVFIPLWPVNHDCAMYLEAGRLLIHGKIPYVDFVDLNPPLVFYLSAIPAFISEKFGLDLLKTFATVVWMVTLMSWLLSLSLLRQSVKDKNLIGPVLFGITSISFLVGEWGEFGQRQHLFTLGIMPFVLCRWLRWQSRVGEIIKLSAPLTVSTGLLAGIMLCLVPQYILIPAAVELYFQIKNKSIRSLFAAEIIVCGLTVAAYAIFLITMPEAAKDALWHRWLPMTGQGYSAYNGDWMSFTTFPFIFGSLPLFIIGLGLAAKYRSTLTTPMIVWYGAAYIAMLIQCKGWYNHYIPMFAASLIFAAVQIKSAIDARSKSSAVALAAVIIAFAICTLPASLVRQTWHYPGGELEMLKKETRPGDNVMVLSAAVPDIYPAILQAYCNNGSRFLFLFPVEMLRYQVNNARNDGEKAKAKAELARVIDEIEKDIDSSKPALILIPCGESETERKLSMVEYFTQVGLVQKLQNHYKLIGECKGRKSNFAAWKRFL